MFTHRSDVEVFNEVKDRPDAPKILARIAYFDECLQTKGKDVDRLRKQIGSSSPSALAIEASRLSEDISRLEYEREAYISSILG